MYPVLVFILLKKMGVVVINFDNTYMPVSVSEDLAFMTFNSPLRSGGNQLLIVKIESLKNDFLINVYNLSFGPPAADGDIDDEIKIHHEDINKVFSTIILFALTF